ncbi:hypothetical protein RIR_jg25861.t1 [Rhizophagus irregularis DAOM 181602=DAOM 197198]|nr:hypothetical protein RIR_jg25861.t1 [Rhizophagus irregularis DAOM 181602=DAOM 197198]
MPNLKSLIRQIWNKDLFGLFNIKSYYSRIVFIVTHKHLDSGSKTGYQIPLIISFRDNSIIFSARRIFKYVSVYTKYNNLHYFLLLLQKK